MVQYYPARSANATASSEKKKIGERGWQPFAAPSQWDYARTPMAQFLIQRIMPGVAELGLDDLKQTSRMGMAHLRDNFPEIEWLESYATDDILYCIYRAPDEATIREYARGSTLPVHKISEVRATLNPDTLDQ